MPDIPHRLRGAIRALRLASHPDRMTGPYAMALAGLADDIEAGRVVMTTPAPEVERLRARVADLEREREDLVHVSAADLAAKLAQVERERDEARALVDTLDARLVSDGSEVLRLRAELAKPVLGPWLHDPNDALCPWSRWSVDGGIIAAVDVLGWSVRHPDGSGRSSGLATGDEGKAAADAAARAFGWRLVDGGEVRDA